MVEGQIVVEEGVGVGPGMESQAHKDTVGSQAPAFDPSSPRIAQEEEQQQEEGRPQEPAHPAAPPNFITAFEGDVHKAQAAYEETLRWRAENDIDHILQTPQPYFKVIKELYPWYFHRKDKKGNVCVHFKLGSLQCARLLKAVSHDDIHVHNCFYQEYMWTRIMPGENDNVTLVFDLKNVRFLDVNSDVLQFIKRALSLQSKHWPARTIKTFIINAPAFFGWVWAIISPFLNARQREKVTIVDEHNTYAALAEWIDEENVPQEYGSPTGVPLGACEQEVELWSYVSTVNKTGGVQFAELPPEEATERGWWY